MEAIKAGLPGRNGRYMQPQLVTDYLNRLRRGAIGQQLNVQVQEPVASRLSHVEIDGLNKQQGSKVLVQANGSSRERDCARAEA